MIVIACIWLGCACSEHIPLPLQVRGNLGTCLVVCVLRWACIRSYNCFVVAVYWYGTSCHDSDFLKLLET